MASACKSVCADWNARASRRDRAQVCTADGGRPRDACSLAAGSLSLCGGTALGCWSGLQIFASARRVCLRSAWPSSKRALWLCWCAATFVLRGRLGGRSLLSAEPAMLLRVFRLTFAWFLRLYFSFVVCHLSLDSHSYCEVVRSLISLATWVLFGQNWSESSVLGWLSASIFCSSCISLSSRQSDPYFLTRLLSQEYLMSQLAPLGDLAWPDRRLHPHSNQVHFRQTEETLNGLDG